MFWMIPSALLKTNIKSGSMNQQSQCSTLPDKDQRGQVALRDKVKEILMSCMLLESLNTVQWLQGIAFVTRWTGHKTYALDLLYVGSQKGTGMSHMPWPKGFEQSNSSRELYHSHYRGYHYSSTWRLSIFSPCRKRWVLACKVRRGVVISYHLPHTPWSLSIV